MTAPQWIAAARRYVVRLEPGVELSIDTIYDAVGLLDADRRGSVAGGMMRGLERSGLIAYAGLRAPSQRRECNRRRVDVYTRTRVGSQEVAS